MKLLLITVSIIAVLTVDGRNSPDDYEALDSAPVETLPIQDSINEISTNKLDSDDEKIIEDRGKRYCVPSPKCSKYGYCVNKRKNCIGSVFPRECCGSRKCMCCVPVCPAPWHKIPGSGRCYLFSEEVEEAPRNWNESRQFCQQEGGARSDLASAGYLPATDADPLLEYVEENNLNVTWVGAYKSASSWLWVDRRSLSVNSNMWGDEFEVQPSGDGECVEIQQEPTRTSLNDLSCLGEIRPFVCVYN